MKQDVKLAEAFNRLRKLKEEVSARNHDLSEEEADVLADRFVHEVIDDMAAEGILTIGRDRIPQHDQ